MSSTSQHPDDQQLQRWLACESSAQEETWIEEHLERCDACALKLDELQRPVDVFELRVKALARSTKSLETHDITNGDIEDSHSIPLDDVPGTIVGLYKLIDVVGEGGMGTVWRATQDRPIKRVVAVKIIKAGMDTKEVIARFESERQALAIMDHPNIARVFDAGATHAGRPYFVMEFVKGIPITDYCDNFRVSTNKRLRLFCQVCDAIQHAHRKGIIHRDIKPSNILVSEDGDTAEIKVIDFGLAKATNQRLTEKTLFTQIGQLVGTPAYMSPEQAESTGVDVDTRTDVYSLGVLLYELLTGAPPFDSTKLLDAGYAEIQRVIRDVDPPTPSTQLSSTDRDSATIAGRRATSPKHLIQIVRGDLDVIVMKSLEKDRSRRYGSPSEFASDVQRFLDHQPILARSPSVAYRLKRLYERNRVAFVAASIVTASVLIGSLTSAIMAIKATRAAELAEQRLVDVEAEKENVKSALADSEAARIQAEQVSQLMVDIFESPDPSNDGNAITVAEMLDRATDRVRTELIDQPDRQAELKLVIGKTYTSLSLVDKAIPLLEEVVQYRLATLGPEDFETLKAQSALANSYYLGRPDDAIATGQSLVAICSKLYGPDHERTLLARNILANAMWRGGNSRKNQIPVLEIREDLVSRAERTLGPSHDSTLTFKNNLANSYSQLRRHEEAIAIRKEILKQRRRQIGDDHPSTLVTMELLVSAYQKNGDFEAALTIAKDAYTGCQTVFGEEHQRTIANRQSTASLLWKAGEHEEAVTLYEKNLEIRRRVEGLHVHEVRFSTIALIKKYGLVGQHEKALLLGQEFVAYAKRMQGPEHSNVEEAAKETALAVAWREGASDSQLRQANEILMDLNRVNPRIKAWRPLGVIQYRRKDYATALDSLTKAIRFTAKDPALRYFVAMAHWQLDDSESARAQFAEAEQLFADRKTNNVWTLAAQREAQRLIVD